MIMVLERFPDIRFSLGAFIWDCRDDRAQWHPVATSVADLQTISTTARAKVRGHSRRATWKWPVSFCYAHSEPAGQLEFLLQSLSRSMSVWSTDRTTTKQQNEEWWNTVVSFELLGPSVHDTNMGIQDYRSLSELYTDIKPPSSEMRDKWRPLLATLPKYMQRDLHLYDFQQSTVAQMLEQEETPSPRPGAQNDPGSGKRSLTPTQILPFCP